MKIRRLDTREVVEVSTTRALQMLRNGEALPVVEAPPVERAVAPEAELR